MNRLVRWYNQNTKTIWKVIGIIALIIIIIQLVNYWVKTDNEKTLQEANQVQSTNNTKDYNSISVEENASTISGDELSINQLSQIDIIDKFVEYCNNQQIEDAYNMLSDECKEEMYPEQSIFEETYYNEIFLNNKRNVNVENWISNIYVVDYNEDYLATGKVSKENSKQDYITVVEYDDETYKLNINNYVGRKEINKANEKNGIKIEVLEVNTYMEYETYKIRIQNNSQNTIKLDDGQEIKGMYIKDDNGMLYGAYTHEISEVDLVVSPRETKEIEIKYYSRYGSEKDITSLGFARIVLNYGTNMAQSIDSLEIEI